MTTQATTVLPAADQPRLRAGTAARLAGLPVATLRVWERRYGVAAAHKTATGHRVYSPDDVARLRLLRQLTHVGHAIGSIATLELPALHALIEGLPTAEGAGRTGALDAVVIGRSAAHALEAVPGCTLRVVYDSLEQAEAAPPTLEATGLLLVRLASLQPPVVARVQALAAALQAESVLVLYAFGTEAIVQALRDAGARVRREPMTARDLAHWVDDARRPQPRTASEARAQVLPRQFSDEALARIAAMPPTVACECLRHMAEIVGQLAGFERYSRDCLAASPADAALHLHLTRTAGLARTMFEQALQQTLHEAHPEA